MKPRQTLVPLLAVVLLASSVSPALAAGSDVGAAHSAATNFMLAGPPDGGAGGSAPPIPVVFSAAGDGELVVGIDAEVLAAGITYSEVEIQQALGVSVPIKVLYMQFSHDSEAGFDLDLMASACYPDVEPGFEAQCEAFASLLDSESIVGYAVGASSDPCAGSGSGSLTCYYYTKYKNECIPTYSNSGCSAFAGIITGNGYSLPTAPAPAPAPTAPEAPDNVIFSDDFADGLDKWTEAGPGKWRTGIFDESSAVPGYTTSNLVAEADSCSHDCVITLSSAIDLSSKTKAKLIFDRFVDVRVDPGEYLKVEAYDGSSWTQLAKYDESNDGDSHKWENEEVSLSGYGNSDFKVRFSALADRSNEDIGLDNVYITGASGPATAPAPAPPAGGPAFSDSFDDLDSWTQSGDGNWESKVSAEHHNYPDEWASDNKVAEASDCDDGCTLTLNSIDLSGEGAAYVTFDRYIDRSLDAREYLKFEVYDGSEWIEVVNWDQYSDQDDTWHSEVLDITAHKSSSFSARFVTEESKSNEQVAVDNFEIASSTSKAATLTLPDTAAPSITAPADVSVTTASSSGTAVSLGSATASDNSGTATVTNNAPATFPVGATTVTWTATDPSGNTATDTQAVTVTLVVADATKPAITAPADVSVTTASSSGTAVSLGNATATDDSGTVTVTNNAPDVFPVGATTVTWTATDPSGNTATATQAVTVALNLDSDGDGVPNSEDICPDDAGTAENAGCPATEIYAGAPHTAKIGYTIEGVPKIKSETATIGFTGYDKDGNPGFVGAAHTFVPPYSSSTESTPSSVEYYEHYVKVPIPDTNFTESRAFSNVTPTGSYYDYAKVRTIDAAFIPITNQSFSPSSVIKNKDGTTIAVEQGKMGDVARNTEIHLKGYRTNSAGSLLYTNATISAIGIHHFNTNDDRYVMTSQGVGNYSSTGGDSGAPVVVVSNNTATLIGMHMGGLCYFTSDSENLLTSFNTKDDCNDEDNYDYYVMINPWETIKSELGLK